jgi:radical SAM superfamily enzyme YgiQ (UPF0313 family)
MRNRSDFHTLKNMADSPGVRHRDSLLAEEFMQFHPDQRLRCLLISPEFRGRSFWSMKEVCKVVSAKTHCPPLGLLTVAALLPQHWEFRLLDLNTRAFSEEDWRWADLICVGGMLPQQQNLREIIDRAIADDKYIVAGGPDPSSQPTLYDHAHTLIVGEGETVIPSWLASWRAGKPYGVFTEAEKPDVTLSPTPRFDLLDLSAYLIMNIQYSRGCPFNCEFCDIIELYGRKPRTKTPAQVTRELDALSAMGYSGLIFIVDDNIIGNKVNLTRRLLPALTEWNKKNNYPFYYETEASMNLMDDEALLAQMRDAEFRFVFLGIETPDPEVLRRTQKRQNSYRPMLQRIHKLYEYGMVAHGGFILGLDGEKPGIDKVMIDLIDNSLINVAMVGFLVALPNTQLVRRLLREKRLLDFRGDLVETEEQLVGCANQSDSFVPVIDQTLAGLNFRTDRDRMDILQDYLTVISNIYEPKSYFDRVLRLIQTLKGTDRHQPRWFEIRREMIAFARVVRELTADRNTRWLFWRNVWHAARKGKFVFAAAMNLMALYLHFRAQVRYTVQFVTQQLPVHAEIERKLAEHDGKAREMSAHRLEPQLTDRVGREIRVVSRQEMNPQSTTP